MGTFFTEHFRTTAPVLLKNLDSTFFHAQIQQYFKFMNLLHPVVTNYISESIRKRHGFLIL